MESLAVRELNILPSGDPRMSVDGRPNIVVLGVGNSGTTIVTNPPYGRRLGDRPEVEELYGEYGDWLKHHAKGATAWILCGDVGLMKKIGLRTKRRIPLFNGPLECRLVEIPLY